jgi:hypothetical protein
MTGNSNPAARFNAGLSRRSAMLLEPQPGTAAIGRRCSVMGEKCSTPQARRAVAKLIERYFIALKRELADQTEAFWARVETAVAANVPADTSQGNKDVKKPIAD